MRLNVSSFFILPFSFPLTVLLRNSLSYSMKTFGNGFHIGKRISGKSDIFHILQLGLQAA
jgi:hypothetical protein